MYFLTSLILFLMILISVGFFTLIERSVLSYMQVRKGPNKVGLMGLLQPFSDGLKLFMKEICWPFNSNILIYYFCPGLSLVYSLFCWVLFPFYVNCINFCYGLLFFLCCCGVSVYSLIICGWSSNSMYALMGAIRGISQSISYEVSLSFFLLCFFVLCDSYSFFDFWLIQYNCWFFFFSFPIFFCWLSCCVAESNRAPFDFSEGESELVSGFNVEYSSGGFSFLFISEYSLIIFICMITCLVFLGGDFYSFLFFVKVVIMCFFYIWIRASLPRYRYDKLMYLAWKCYLPISMNYIVFFVLVKFMVLYHFFLLSY